MARFAIRLSIFVALCCLWASLGWSSVAWQEQLAGELTVSGTVLEPGTRTPVPGEQVLLMGPDATVADRVESRGDIVTSDLDGRFRFRFLRPGRYIITLPDAIGSATELNRTFDLTPGLPLEMELWSPPSATVSGRITDSEGNPPARALVALVQPIYSLGRRTFTSSTTWAVVADSDGRYEVSAPPGRYYLRVEFLSDSSAVRLAPTLYYPREVEFERAVPVTLTRGAVLSGMDLEASDREPRRIQFTFPLPAQLSAIPDSVLPLEASIQPVDTGPVEIRDFQISLEEIGADTYRTVELPPGQYEILIRYSGALLGAFPDVDWNGLDPIANLTVDLEEADVDLGVVSPQPHATIDGRVVVDGQSRVGFDFTSLPEFQFGRWRPAQGFAFRVRTEADGQFRVENVFPERYRFSQSFHRPTTRWIPEGWFVESVTSGAQDVMRDGLVVTQGATLPLEIRLSSEGGSIGGAVRFDGDALAPGALVVLIPPAQTRGPATVFPATIVDGRGRYQLDGIPTGEYRVLALDSAGRTQVIAFWEDPEFLREYESRGELVRFEPGERIRLDLRAIPISD